ncbi:putative PEP-binding protein [Corynebacterium kroppenstedtii]|uniref:putative PEP-binding protein n=1 Tax=Corynebacterium sp. PCR 32 TaxID=3351342 RepID=UPI0030AE32B7
MQFKTGISLSGETFPLDCGQEFDEIGLIRSEYLFRSAGRFPSGDSCKSLVTPYLDAISRSFSKAVWYRTLEVDTAEANVLDGCDHILVEDDRLRGIRGIRRSIIYPDPFIAELQAVNASTVENIGIIVPFVSTIKEIEWAAKVIKTIVPRARLACMVEIPSLIPVIPTLRNLGFERVVVGCNDLGSLCMGTTRKAQTSSGIPFEFRKILDHIADTSARNGLECVAAGYLTAEMIDHFHRSGFSGSTVHYSDLPGVFNISPDKLPEIKHLSLVKEKTREAIKHFNHANGVHQVIY